MRDIRSKIMVLMGMIIGCVGLISLTYTWQSISQHATNTLSASGKVPVELIKKEKQSDGTITNRPVKGAIFYLFQEDGTQIGGSYQSDEEGKINVMLPPGAYYFEEQDPGKYHTYDIEDGKLKTRYPFLVKEDGEKVIVEAYNRLLKGDLLIHKIVKNQDGSDVSEEQKQQAFLFQIFFSNEETYHCVIGEETISIRSGDTISLKHDQIAQIQGIPIGVQYRVIEQPVKPYQISSSNSSGTMYGQEVKATFINTYEEDYGALHISKEVVGNSIDRNQTFTFVAVINGESQEFTLKHGESYRIPELAIGTRYEVYEKQADGYVGEVWKYEGEIKRKGEIHLPFVNHKGPYEAFGDLIIEKQIVEEEVDRNASFTFEIVFSTGKRETFTLKHGEQIQFSSLPHGTTFELYEHKSPGYTPVIDKRYGTIVGGKQQHVIYQNEKYQAPQLVVRKKLAGNYGSEAENKAFQFHIKINGKQEDFVLHANEEKVFDVTYGSVYEVWEDDFFEEGFVTTIEQGYGTIQNEIKEVTITNTFDPRYQVIEGEKRWELQGQPETVIPKEIVVYLKKGNQIVEEVVVRADEEGKWKYRFEVAKYDAFGNEITYTIEEKEIKHFEASYEGYHITNTYIDHVTINLPQVEKKIIGNPKEMPVFTFVLEEKGSILEEIQIIGEGKNQFSPISYQEVGSYHYRIYEKKQNIDGWTMDERVYEVEVCVEEVEGKLQAKIQMSENLETFVFENQYKTSEAEEWVKIHGEKTWEHKNNPNPPERIVVELYQNEKLLYQKEVTQQEHWKYEFKVAKYDENQEMYTYRVAEKPIEDYVCEVQGFNLHNIYIGNGEGTIENEGTLQQGGSNTGDYTTMLQHGIQVVGSMMVMLVMIRNKRRKETIE